MYFDSQNEEFYGSISGRFYIRICIIRPKQSRLPTMHGGTKYSPENPLTKISMHTIKRKDCTCTCTRTFILKLCATRTNKCTRRVHSRLSTKKSEENDKYTWRMFRYGTVECKSQDVGFFKENDKVQPRGVKVQL